MLWGQADFGLTQAAPGVQAVCPSCQQTLVPKCGQIVAWHWSHKQKDCDLWSEPESEWHLNWKQSFPAEWQEVVIGAHRADVKTPSTVIEFQRSAISANELREREEFYGKMVWVIDASGFNLEAAWHWHYKKFDYCNPPPPPGNLFDLLEGGPGDAAYAYKDWLKRRGIFARNAQEQNPCFRWLWPRKTWLYAQKPLYLDLGGPDLLRVKKFYSDGKYFSCQSISKERWLHKISS